jgi:hypothetical protein
MTEAVIAAIAVNAGARAPATLTHPTGASTVTEGQTHHRHYVHSIHDAAHSRLMEIA